MIKLTKYHQKAPTVNVAITAGVVKRFQNIPKKTATTNGGVKVESETNHEPHK